MSSPLTANRGSTTAVRCKATYLAKYFTYQCLLWSDSGINAVAVLISVCIWLVIYTILKNMMQMLCDAGQETACPEYEAPPPPPSADDDFDDGNLWDIATDEEGAQVLWIVFTHIFISIFRPTAIGMLCCCKDPPQQMPVQVIVPLDQTTVISAEPATVRGSDPTSAGPQRVPASVPGTVPADPEPDAGCYTDHDPDPTLQSELEQLTVKQLRERAATEGVDADAIEHARDGHRPKEDVRLPLPP